MNMKPQIELFPLASLVLSPDNPRQEVADAYIEQLADSLREIGLIQSLAGIRNGDTIEIVAGGCRLRALRLASEDRPELAEVPVAIAPDPETAKLWAAAENEVRRALLPGAIIRSARNMRARGSSVTDIARIFALPHATVSRYLALADLPDEIMDALDKREISFDQAKILTLARDPKTLAEGFAAAKDGEATYSLKRRFMGEISDRDFRVRFVGAEALEQAGCIIIRDLFDEDFTVEGEDIVDRLFSEAMDSKLEALRAEGWLWVEYAPEARGQYDAMHGMAYVKPDLDVLTEDERAVFEQISSTAPYQREDSDRRTLADLMEKRDSGYSDQLKAVTGVVLHQDYNGHICTLRGLVRAQDAEAADDFLTDNQRADLKPTKAAATKDNSPKPDFSAALKMDLEQARMLAIATQIREKPELALDLLAFILSGALPYQSMLGISHTHHTQLPEKAEGMTVPSEITEQDHSWTSVEDKVAALDDFRAKGKKHRNAALALAVATSLQRSCGGKDLVGKLELLADAHMRNIWTPSVDNLLGRVSVDYLDRLFDQLLPDPSDAAREAYGALKKKGEKAAFLEQLFQRDGERDKALGLTEEDTDRIDNWTPDLSA